MLKLSSAFVNIAAEVAAAAAVAKLTTEVLLSVQPIACGPASMSHPLFRKNDGFEGRQFSQANLSF